MAALELNSCTSYSDYQREGHFESLSRPSVPTALVIYTLIALTASVLSFHSIHWNQQNNKKFLYIIRLCFMAVVTPTMI